MSQIPQELLNVFIDYIVKLCYNNPSIKEILTNNSVTEDHLIQFIQTANIFNKDPIEIYTALAISKKLDNKYYIFNGYRYTRSLHPEESSENKDDLFMKLNRPCYYNRDQGIQLPTPRLYLPGKINGVQRCYISSLGDCIIETMGIHSSLICCHGLLISITRSVVNEWEYIVILEYYNLGAKLFKVYSIFNPLIHNVRTIYLDLYDHLGYQIQTVDMRDAIFDPAHRGDLRINNYRGPYKDGISQILNILPTDIDWTSLSNISNSKYQLLQEVTYKNGMLGGKYYIFMNDRTRQFLSDFISTIIKPFPLVSDIGVMIDATDITMELFGVDKLYLIRTLNGEIDQKAIPYLISIINGPVTVSYKNIYNSYEAYISEGKKVGREVIRFVSKADNVGILTEGLHSLSQSSIIIDGSKYIMATFTGYWFDGVLMPEAEYQNKIQQLSRNITSNLFQRNEKYPQITGAIFDYLKI